MKSQIKISDPEVKKRIIIETTAWIEQMVEFQPGRQPLLEQYSLLITLTSFKFLGISGSFDIRRVMPQIYKRLVKEAHELKKYEIREQRHQIKRLIKEVIFYMFLDEFQLMIYLATRKNLAQCQEPEIEGVVQDILIKVYNRLELLHGKSRDELQAYLWKMIHYSCIDFWRDKKRRFRPEECIFLPKSNTYQFHHQIDADYKDHLLSFLTPKQREVMELWILGYRYQEIANLTECSLASVKNLILRSRKVIKERVLMSKLQTKQAL